MSTGTQAPAKKSGNTSEDARKRKVIAKRRTHQAFDKLNAAIVDHGVEEALDIADDYMMGGLDVDELVNMLLEYPPIKDAPKRFRKGLDEHNVGALERVVRIILNALCRHYKLKLLKRDSAPEEWSDTLDKLCELVDAEKG